MTSNTNDRTPSEAQISAALIGDLPLYSPHVSTAFSVQADGIDEVQSKVTARIRATNVAIGLRRLPAGFYVTVKHCGRKWRTENKPISVNDDVEWCEPIPIPSDFSVVVCLRIYASFELQPVLGDGGQLRELTVTVKELLERSANGLPFTFYAEEDDVISPCSSIWVIVKEWKRGHGNSLASEGLHLQCSTTETLDQLGVATDRGHSALSRYRRHGERSDLECSIEQFEHALKICPLDHPCRAAAQSNLAMAKLIHSRVDGEPDPSLDLALALYHDALIARPVGHPDRPSTLIQLAIVLLTRLKERHREVDAEQAGTLLHEVMDLTSAGIQQKQAAIFLLEMCTGRRVDLVEADNRFSAVQESPLSSEEKDLLTLGTHLLRRFNQSGRSTDLDQAITALEDSVRSTSVSDQRHVFGLIDLGVALSQRFARLGELDDLERAISRNREAVELAPDGHSHRPCILNNFGNSLFTRFECFGQLSDLEQAIQKQRDAINITPDGGPHRLGYLSNLGDSLIARFHCLGELGDLEEVISWREDVVDNTPHGHPHKPSHLYTLATSLVIRFQRLGELNDLEQAISRLRDAVDCTPDGCSQKLVRLHVLGGFYFTRFQRLGEPSDLDQAILKCREGDDLTPYGHPHKPKCLKDLVHFVKARFDRSHELNDLEFAILKLRDIVNLTPDARPDKPRYLNNLAFFFIARFDRLHELTDLDHAISNLSTAADLIPDDRPDKLDYLRQLGDALCMRFERLGEFSDIEQAISRSKEAVDLTPDDHPDKPSFMQHLGSYFFNRFEHLGDLGDLEHAISIQQDVLEITPDTHPEKAGRLNILGISLRTRFQRLGDVNDLAHAISCQRHAVDLTPDDHHYKPIHLHNLSNSLAARFKLSGGLNDLEQAISGNKNALDFTPDGHPEKSCRLGALGSSLCFRFHRLGNLSDLEQGISRHRNAVDLTPDGHPHKSGHLYNLGSSLLLRFQHLGDLSDLEQAISKLRHAIDLTREGHPERTLHLTGLADSFSARFKHLGGPRDLEQATSLYSQAARVSVGSSAPRFHASMRWISSARALRHASLLDAYSVAISLLPQLAWTGHSLFHRFHELAKGADVVREAAAAALDSGQPETAVEWLEQGRTVVWGELFQLRSSYQELSLVRPDHARKLRELSIALEDAGSTREKSLSLLLEQTRDGERLVTMPLDCLTSLERKTHTHRTLAIERDRLLQEIRRIPGFERFLLHQEFSRLRASAHSGPVVVVNAAENRCDALIILADKENVVHVTLPTFNIKRCETLQNALNSLLGPARLVPCDDRVGRPALRKDLDWESILSILWKNVVKPVLDALRLCTSGNLSRIFWCPTGPLTFLPIHAAGLYGKQYSEPGHKVFDFVVSSYVPNLSVLMPPNRETAPRGDLRILVVPQSLSDGQPRLPGVRTELEYIKAAIRNSPVQSTLVEPSDGTVEEVLAQMEDADWVHFACHGVQDPESFGKSGICLAHGRRLKMSDVTQLSRPHGGLAFLSACQTAMGDRKLSDEAFHITAGMLVAGFGGVVGTMWSISDRAAPRVAKDVYEELFRAGTAPEYRGAARALHNAVGRLRDNGASFAEWVPFIHVGL